MRRATALTLALIAAASLAGCGKKKPVPTVAPPPPTTTAAPVVQPKKAAPPPPLTAAQKTKIAADFDAARKLVLEAQGFRRKGEEIEMKAGREAANDTLVSARKLYRKAVGMTERWVEPEAMEVTAAQVAADPELKTYIDERARWIQEDASMGQKLNVR